MASQPVQTSLIAPTDNRPGNHGIALSDHVVRMDGVEKVTGRAKYSRDRYLPNSLFACFVRCPYGSATLESFDVSAATAIEGVVEVEVTGKAGSYQGQTVGHVVAESPEAMRRGLRALNVKWRSRPSRTEIEHAMKPAPAPTPQTKTVLHRAAKVVEAVYTTPVQTHSSLETHGCVIDHKGDSAIAYVSTQGTFAARDGLDEPLGLARSKYEVVCEHIGGGFGSKLNGAGKEGVLAAKLGAKYTRPVYLFVNRAEDHLDTGNRPSSRAMLRLGVNADGTIVGGQVQTWGGVGIANRGGGVGVPSGRYRFGTVQQSHEDVTLNAGAPRPFRAPGSPQGAFAEELILDELAAAIDKGPLQFRLDNVAEPEFGEMLLRGADLIGWKNRAANGSQTGVLRRGMGMGTASWGRFPAQAEAEVVIGRDGSVEARTGTQDIGTGTRTIMAVVVAERLHIPIEVVSVRIGRSTLPIGPGSGGSMTAHNTCPPMVEAAGDAMEKLLKAVATRRGVEAGALSIRNGEVFDRDQRLMTFKEACALLPGDSVMGRGTWNGQKQSADPTVGTSNGAQFVDLVVDTETGVIHLKRIVAIQACGMVVSRKLAESQIIGGVIQGLSYALFENKILDRKTGSMVNPNLEMYKIAGSADMPHIEPVLWRQENSGVRSLGEPPTIPTAGAIACAVYNAIGAPVRSLPLTPARVLAAIGSVKGGAQ